MREKEEKKEMKGESTEDTTAVNYFGPSLYSCKTARRRRTADLKMGGLHGNVHPIGKEIIFCAPQKDKGL